MNEQQKYYFAMEAHLLKDEKPSAYFRSMDDTSVLSEFPFTLLKKLKNTPQSPTYHPEGSVWNHTMLVIDEAAEKKGESSDKRAFMWAALLHDIGKPDTTRNRKGKITSYDHDKLGAELTVRFLEQFESGDIFIQKVSSLVRWHMQILYVVKSLPYADIDSMRKQVSIRDVALLGLCDRLGRVGADRKYEKENIRIFLDKCKQMANSD